MNKILKSLSPLAMVLDKPEKLKYLSPIAMLLSSGNKDKDTSNQSQTDQVTSQTEQAKQQKFSKGGKIDKGMEADRTNPLQSRKIKDKDMESPDYTPATPIEIYQDLRPVTGKKPAQIQGFGKARKPIR